ncbi:hypothetical protein [Bacillus sp. REN16]|uniref:hypothetical protein n=1 Tax=Bacillus sp. REN16 TaxID=2887296 RepID=UPI001E5F7263|nr:hypothetical protein [Bacillus sp. REN16]MCC3356025.1 hypothetical protein [Bacillus sp. REN16]
MFLEAEVYPMLYWGFWSVMATQFIFLLGVWISKRFDFRSFTYLLIYIVLFGLAGENLLTSINTYGHETSMASEEASFHMGVAGVTWAVSVLFLLLGIYRLTKK